MKTLRFLSTLLAICLITSCTKDLLQDEKSQATFNGNIDSKINTAQVTIEIISNITYHLTPKNKLNSKRFSDYGIFKEVVK